MYENAFNAIEKALRAEEGIANELDYVEQTSWVLFLRYLHDLEGERKDRAELEGKDYRPIIEGKYRWDRWAAPKLRRSARRRPSSTTFWRAMPRQQRFWSGSGGCCEGRMDD